MREYTPAAFTLFVSKLRVSRKHVERHVSSRG